MLKSKKAIYILIPLNLFIWGYFGYRLYSAFTEGEAPDVNTSLPLAKQDELKDSVTYKLSMDYKDPFLKESKREQNLHVQNYASGNSESQNKKKIRNNVPAIIPPKPQPEVKYLGLIKNNSSGLSAALVSVNGQSKLIKQNESIDGIIFKSFNNDSLVAKWGKERIVARK